jgi:hypothetical protein
MTSQTHEDPEEHEPEPEAAPADAFFGEGPAGDPTPDEFMSPDQQGRVSEDTGVVYDDEGSPEETPLDEELRDQEDDHG